AQIEQQQQHADNPFFKPYGTFFEIPDFANITTDDYIPAFEAGMTELQEQISTIANNPQPPTFENTIEAMEFSGDLLTRVSYVFFNLAGADTNDALQAISKQISPKLSSSQDDIFLNPMLFQRVKTLHEQRNSLSLNTAQAKLLEDTYKSFTRGGANLSAEDKITLRGLNEQI
ncbi:peptidase M3, partial [Shewanella sp. 30m-9]